MSILIDNEKIEMHDSEGDYHYIGIDDKHKTNRKSINEIIVKYKTQDLFAFDINENTNLNLTFYKEVKIDYGESTHMLDPKKIMIYLDDLKF